MVKAKLRPCGPISTAPSVWISGVRRSAPTRVFFCCARPTNASTSSAPCVIASKTEGHLFIPGTPWSRLSGNVFIRSRRATRIATTPIISESIQPFALPSAKATKWGRASPCCLGWRTRFWATRPGSRFWTVRFGVPPTPCY